MTIDAAPDRVDLPARMHHHAWVVADQERTRHFYEDVLGFPLVATWCEVEDLRGKRRAYCHTFFGLADGSALAFFQFADQADQDLFDPALAPSPFRHIAMRVDADGQAEMERRLTSAQWKPEQTYVLEHGYCRSLYVRDPNGLLIELTADHPDVESINATRAASAHEDLTRWLGGDHTSNNTYR
jgi:catechol 2,3-dioxygenase-like lactoylglutathione lyase family enzyme